MRAWLAATSKDSHPLLFCTRGSTAAEPRLACVLRRPQAAFNGTGCRSCAGARCCQGDAMGTRWRRRGRRGDRARIAIASSNNVAHLPWPSSPYVSGRRPNACRTPKPGDEHTVRSWHDEIMARRARGDQHDSTTIDSTTIDQRINRPSHAARRST